MEQPTVRDLAIQADLVDFHDWRAWSLSADGGTIAAAQDFGWPDGVAIDLASGVVERRGQARLVAADRPLWQLADDGGLQDPAAMMTFTVPPDDEVKATATFDATVALRSSGAGVLARLVRSEGGAHLRLQVWNRQAAVTWTAEIEPVPDTAGIALSPSGDAVALVQSTERRSADPHVELRGSIGVRMYDVRDGALRWSVESTLLGDSASWVRQPVGFSADGAALWISGRSPTSEARVVEERSARDGAPGRTIPVDRSVNQADTVGLSHTHLWIGSVVYRAAAVTGESWLPVQERGSSWSPNYALYAIGTRRPTLDTESSAPERDGAIDRRAVFGEERRRGVPNDSSVRAMRPTSGGGFVLVQVLGDHLRVTSWKAPPGVRDQ